jgi:hypothetical protein
MSFLARALAVSVLSIASGCVAAGPRDPAAASTDEADNAKVDSAASGSRYAAMQSYLEDTGGDIDGWFGLKGTLKDEFDRVCGDTFCGGDLPPWGVNLDCSVNASSGKISRCTWLFAGAYASVNPSTGTLTQNKKFWTCSLPWSGLTPAELMRKLAPGTTPTDTALQRPLAGGRSTYDALASCGLGQ